jgi:hypothetical protein
MLTLPPSVKIFVATFLVDMREQFDVLVATVQLLMEVAPFSRYLFVFFFHFQKYSIILI